MKKQVRFRHKLIGFIAKLILIPYYKIKYNYRYKKLKQLKKGGPYLVLANHVIASDPLVLSFAFPFSIYYFATEQIFNLGLLSKLLVYAVNPISKSKAVSDLSAIRKAKAIVKEGGSIGLFPEGNVTYSGISNKIDISTIKLIKLLKIPVIIYHIQGLYLSSPRWSVNNKKGKSFGKLYKIIKPEEYLNLSDDELLVLINEDMQVNAYDQLERNFKGKQIALGLERLAFMDLKTNMPNVCYTKDDMLLSTASDFNLKYNVDGTLNYENETIDLIKLEELTKKSYLEYLKTINQNDVILTSQIDVQESTATKKSKVENYEITLFKDKILFNNSTTFTIYLKDIVNMSIQGKKKLILYLEDKTWLVTFDLKTSPYIYLMTYQINKQIKGEDYDLISISTIGL